MHKYIIGMVIGALAVVAIGCIMDYYMYGTINPCTTISYEDGSSIIKCSVKE